GQRIASVLLLEVPPGTLAIDRLVLLTRQAGERGNGDTRATGQCVLQCTGVAADNGQAALARLMVEQRAAGGQVEQLALPTLQPAHRGFRFRVRFNHHSVVRQGRRLLQPRLYQLCTSSAPNSSATTFAARGLSAIRSTLRRLPLSPRATRASTAAISSSAFSCVSCLAPSRTARETGTAGCWVISVVSIRASSLTGM